MYNIYPLVLFIFCLIGLLMMYLQVGTCIFYSVRLQPSCISRNTMYNCEKVNNITCNIGYLVCLLFDWSFSRSFSSRITGMANNSERVIMVPAECIDTYMLVFAFQAA